MNQKPEIKLSTKDILRIIPLNEEVRAKILADYPDNMDYDQGVRIEELAWDVYYLHFDLVYQRILQEEVDKELQVMDSELHDRIVRLTEEELLQKKEIVTTNVELDKLRSELQDIVQSVQ